MTSCATHEAAHVAGCIAACGWVPLEVRVDRPGFGIEGRTVANFRDRGPDRSYLVAVLMGPLSEGELISWRPTTNGYRPGSDRRAVARLIELLDLEKHEYLSAVADAEHLHARDDVKAAIRLVALALRRVPVLSERQIRELLGPATLAHFDINQEGVTT